MRRRDKRLVPVAEFADRDRADDAWVALDEQGIAGSVVGEPSTLGSHPVYRVYVASIDVEAAQTTIAPLIRPD